MKHTINLFRQDLLPPQPILDLRRLLIAILVVWVVMVGWRVTMEFMDLRVKAQLTELQREQTQKQMELSRVAAEVAQLRIDPELQSRVRRLEADLQNKRSVMAQFGNLDDMQMYDYAALLTELAQVHKDGIWLKRIQENNGILNLSGGTSDPAVLPTWIRSFRGKTHLSEREFGMIRITRDDDASLTFSVTGIDRGDLPRSARTDNGSVRPVQRPRRRIPLEEFINE